MALRHAFFGAVPVAEPFFDIGLTPEGLLNAPIALAAQLLDQDIEFVLDDTDGAGADLHEAQPAGFDEAFVKGGLADAEALQHLTFSQELACRS